MDQGTDGQQSIPQATVKNTTHNIIISPSAALRAYPWSSDSIVDDKNLNQLHSSIRNASPLRASFHSVASSDILTSNASASLPHLKRKTGHKHMRQEVHAYPTDTKTTTHIISSASLAPGPSSPTKSSRLCLTRSNTAPSPKRARASHSSYGVETIVGPPPSFDTRRTYSQERVWKVDRSKALCMTPVPDRAEAEQQQQDALEDTDSPETRQDLPTTPLLVNSSPDTADTQSIATPSDAEEVSVMEVRNEQGLGLSNDENGSKASSGSHKSEDLFLNIARVDATRPSSSKGEKRKTRISMPFMSTARPSTSHAPESHRLRADSSVTTPRAEAPAYQNKRSSLQFGQLRALDQASEKDSVEVANSGLYSQRSSTLYADTIRAPTRSSHGVQSSRLVSDGGYLDKPKFEQNTTESTASTNAPSTVWDELDDLKSRIRKLELTGKLPPSSAAAMSTAERPRTATTAATTMSSSPKHNKVASQLQSHIEGVPLTVHPLLHEALGNAKAVVSHDVFQKLQATAQDALQLAAMTSIDGQTARNGAPNVAERQIRRRTESMCRSLTELAIALASETKATPPTAHRPPSRDHHISPANGFRSRRYSQSNDATDRPPVSVRVQSRLESRRASGQVGYFNTRHTSPELESPTALPQYPQSGSRVAQIAGTYRPRRSQAFLDGANDEDDSNPGARPVSRAMTDLAAVRRTSRDHAAASREYTSQHPLPSKRQDTTSVARTPLPSNLSTNFISRRKHPSPVTQSAAAESSPLAPRQSWGRISVVHQDSAPSSDTTSEAPTSTRSLSTRRSFGLASRIGSSVGNRLRAARTERIESRSYREPQHSVLGEDLIDRATERVQ